MDLAIFRALNICYIFILFGFLYLLVVQTGKQKSANYYFKLSSFALWIAMCECVASDYDPSKPGVPATAMFTIVVASLFVGRLYSSAKQINK